MIKDRIKELPEKIYSNFYVKTILKGLAILIIAVFLVFIFLIIFTRHGQNYPIPDFRGMSQADVHKLAKKYKLRIEIADSVYIVTKKPGSVIEQNPSPGTHVKQNRKIFLTINAKNPKKVEMPDITDITLRQAKATLDLHGLIVGNLSFVPDIAVNNVLKQKFQGKDIEPGTLIPKGSKIDLVLGRGMAGEKTGLPLIVGLKLNEAKNYLIEASLNLGQVKFDETIKDYKDSLNARVYSQYPAFFEGTTISFGTRVDLWLTLNESRIPEIRNNAIIVDSSYLKLDSLEIEDIIE